MLQPAPTSKIDHRLARGVFEGTIPEALHRPALIVLTFPNTSYQVHLVPTSPLTQKQGQRCIGVVRAEARRVDVVGSGGRYLDPVIGRPQRVQGSIISVEPALNEIVVDAGFPIHCRLTDPRQRAASYEAGQFVSFDVLENATFSPGQSA